MRVTSPSGQQSPHLQRLGNWRLTTPLFPALCSHTYEEGIKVIHLGTQEETVICLKKILMLTTLAKEGTICAFHFMTST